ncbi:calcium/proton exchanger [Cryptococcus deuterogattii 99/473]|uniref:Vacuolar calcium ion transporter n=1 Tax=Cryptococcus deuterogattii Ram5 TaxID=1296110 RepID=A0A0D0UVX7_9TREE|nr:calcium/proton exchanger [Cryptococcus deuterogattii LA55]KIR39376.1 calcium/proton exchanger [Cryptococcus deuterogattii Ram5]KIR94799.1 calcium/proton exchanger [Cryptococcus deuterogattii CBS 10090]KIY54621.1 calcium/proton exchanger [Cryptococcus deuterogattii 99/473]
MATLETSPLLPSQASEHTPVSKPFDLLGSTRYLLLGSWINVLLICVPLSFAAEAFAWSAAARFTTSFLAIVPLAKLLGDSTEQLSMKLGQTLGGLLNATFGNAVELIVAIAALRQDELDLVQRSLLGSVLSNLLLVLGMSFFAAGFFFYESTFQATAAQAKIDNSSSLVGTLLGREVSDLPDRSLKGLLLLSRGTSVILLLTYFGYLYFQLRTHSGLFEAESEEAEEMEVAAMDQWSAGTWLLIITVITAFCADILVGSIDETAQQWNIPKRFIGLILLPLVGNAAEHVTSVWMACKGKMELTIGVSVGSSIQIAAGMIPLLVIIAWPLQKDLTLFFANFETIVLFVSVMLVNLLLQDGRSNYMEGVMSEREKVEEWIIYIDTSCTP